MTVFARSFAFEGMNFDAHHMALDGFVSAVVGEGFERGANCLTVEGRETTIVLGGGANCVQAAGGEASIEVVGLANCSPVVWQQTLIEVNQSTSLEVD